MGAVQENLDAKCRVSKMFVQLRFRRTKPGPKPDSRNIRLAAVVILRPSRTLPSEEARKKMKEMNRNENQGGQTSLPTRAPPSPVLR